MIRKNFFNKIEDELIHQFVTKMDFTKITLQIRQFTNSILNELHNKNSIHPSSKISPKATIEGPVLIEEGVIIQDNAYVKGPVIILKNTLIGNHSFVRDNSIIGSNTIVGNSCEIANSIIIGNTTIAHYNTISHSIIGSNVNFSSYASTSCFLLKNDNIQNPTHEVQLVTSVGEKLKIESQKFGAIIGDDCRIGSYASTNPGTVLERGCILYPNIALKSGYYEKGSIITIKGYFSNIRVERRQDLV